MKNILGLDLGTNSIGWALVSRNEENKIEGLKGLGSRIIPMSQDILGKFDSGNSISQTAERTGFRGTRRLRERHLLRRERLHRVLHLLGFLPEHYEQTIDFEKRLGKFLPDTESKLPWKEIEEKKYEFLFQDSFEEMLSDFAQIQPQLLTENRKVPYDWTIYYLRKKALQQKITKEELAWILLNFNQKRGYYQLRGEEEEENPNKRVEFHALKVVDVTADEPQKGKADIWYNLILENGWVYRRSSKTPLFDWKDKIKEFIVTTDLNDDGSIKTDKEGVERRSFRAPSPDDWTLLKKKTELDINKSDKTVGTYIYDTLLQNPSQKIRGKLVRTIERKFYKEELKQILEKQKEFYNELNNDDLFQSCVTELYPYNEAHRSILQNSDFTGLFLNDIIFYQRPLKSKKSLISNCSYEFRAFKNESGVIEKLPIKCISKSHPLYQEFRLWQFIHNLRIYEREKEVNGKFQTDVDVTTEFLQTIEDRVNLFDWLNDRKEIKQDTLLQSYFKIKKRNKSDDNLPYRWNYVEDKEYPCNETSSQIHSRLSKLNIPVDFFGKETEFALWHILYSVEDKEEIKKALKSFAGKYQLSDEFVDVFAKFPPFKKEYGAYSEKAIKKLLPLMRMGKYWDEHAISDETKKRIQSIQERLADFKETEKKIEDVSDDDIPKQVLKSFVDVENPYSGLNTFQACYAVYGRHSEASDLTRWKTPEDIDNYLAEFKQHSLRNPIVEQVITETLRVVRDVWKKYGDIAEIHIELGREMKNPADKRAQMTARISENENTNLRIKALLMELKNHSDVENVRPYSPSQQEILKIYEEGALNSVAEIPDDILKITKLSQPTQSELIRYKLWLEQKYKSPYTGLVIPLGKLFTSDYEIEHIIPQSRYFDDSLSNKVICESEVNKKKDNQLGYEFVKKHAGEIVDLGFGKKVQIQSIDAYERFVQENYGKNRGKLKKLLLEDIPESFIERQLNDSRYISKIVMGLLSNIVREDKEQEAKLDNVIPCTGGITTILKQDWGLNDVWNRIVTPRFERMNLLTKSNSFGEWVNKNGKKVFQTELPIELQKGFNKKRIDHRHHSLDAVIIACATREHIQYLNNEHAHSKNNDVRYGLRNKLRRIEDREIERIENGNKVRKTIKVACEFHKPWDTFTQDVQNALENTIVSFKQNLRVINKTVNHIQSYKDESSNLQLDRNGKPIKISRKQVKGDNWAIRKPLHKDTVAGHVNLRFKKQVNLSVAIDQWEMLVDKNLKTKIKQLINDGLDKKKIQKFFADKENSWMGKEVSKPEVYYFSDEKEKLVASRVTLDISFNSKKIESITDTGIQKILRQHLEKYNEEKDGKIIEYPELAFAPEAIEEMNKNISALNKGKFHQPILKVRTYEPKGNKFNVGVNGNKKDKFVEAAKGTNLFFAIYADENGNRSYETIPLNIVVERLKQRLNAVPEKNEKGYSLLFYLSPNDLVYVPTEEEIDNPYSVDTKNLTKEQKERIYKIVSFTNSRLYGIPYVVASPIANKLEFTQLNKLEFVENRALKENCCKLKVDRLGNLL
ncbi:MAG: CRISPR-associated endonuclease Cas9 [Candidatus Ordinivivax streblomastigis]|uniref:CRISPR-associated endonuclease Cas9 n=1 Tax=Candidatus Ordinivivax streblomastigis TaxID=2540710 RepID=A0A5M8NZ26_9BACT|nr:MAG: CRISPR-associated endonuclease Cas9 [Candidatus Ordinivivax streblomastigis]